MDRGRFIDLTFLSCAANQPFRLLSLRPIFLHARLAEFQSERDRIQDTRTELSRNAAAGHEHVQHPLTGEVQESRSNNLAGDGINAWRVSIDAAAFTNVNHSAEIHAIYGNTAVFLLPKRSGDARGQKAGRDIYHPRRVPVLDLEAPKHFRRCIKAPDGNSVTAWPFDGAKSSGRRAEFKSLHAVTFVERYSETSWPVEENWTTECPFSAGLSGSPSGT
ncbi:MAG TPA: hypothetical protein VFA04_19955 [Bryobacteraceae bacterium]|nr:hypothetical protein [Bryobacteraceae bacterium]